MKHYLQDMQQVLREVDSSPEGLAPQEAVQRRDRYGANKFNQAKKDSMIKRFFLQMADPMILLLIAAAVISAAFGEAVDMIIILFVVILNAVLGVLQESKAEKAIEALQKMSASYSKVRRGGTVSMVKTEDIVPGDIVLLEAGDSVPADLRILESASLKVEEASLTGESVPVEKDAETLETAEEVPLGDRRNMAYQGTSVVYGRGEGVVVATGMSTEMGKIAGILAGTDQEKTPLQKKLGELSKVLSIAVLGICVFIFLFSLLQNGGITGGHVLELFMVAVSLAVAAIPEGLVAVVTVVLSIGVTKMSARSAIIRRLTAVETLGCTQVICSDKTGTLTQNKMTVVDHFGPEDGLAAAMALCTDVRTAEDGSFLGDPTEIALVNYAADGGKIKSELEQTLPRVGEAPFDSLRKMMSTVHQKPKGGFIQYTKGAPDELLKRCSSIRTEAGVLPLTEELRDQILEENRRMAAQALRVLAAAQRAYDTLPGSFEADALEQELTFLGLTGMIDPVRPEVRAAVQDCRAAGIQVVMITGDHKDTAVAIAKELGILTDGRQAMTGAELSQLSDEEFDRAVERCFVYARVQPEHKVRIVNAWRRKGMITAMTGDGVNDAPALKVADIGVGMGITGTDVTKNVADMVLADDNFATIVHAVDEGRRIYENILKAVQFLLSSNLAEVVALFVATLLNVRLLMPIHLLWINLITDSLPALALGMEPAETDNMKKPPRSSKNSIFADRLGFHLIYQGLAVGALTFMSYFLGDHESHIEGMTMAFVTLSMCEIFHSLNMRSRNKSIFGMKTHNKYLLGAMLLSFALTLGVVYAPFNGLFQLVALTPSEFAESALLAFAIIPIVEIFKLAEYLIVRNRRSRSLPGQR